MGTSSRDDQERVLERVIRRRGKVRPRGQREVVWAWWLPRVGTPPSSPYLLPFHPWKARGSIKSRLSLRALGNINDNQPTTALLRTTNKLFLELKARAGKAQLVIPEPVPIHRECQALALLHLCWLSPAAKCPALSPSSFLPRGGGKHKAGLDTLRVSHSRPALMAQDSGISTWVSISCADYDNTEKQCAGW